MPYINSHQGKLIMAHLKKGPMIRAYLVWKWSCHPIKLASKFGWFLSTIKHWNLENSNQISVKLRCFEFHFVFGTSWILPFLQFWVFFTFCSKGKSSWDMFWGSHSCWNTWKSANFLSKNWKTPGFKGQSVTNRNLDCIAFTPFIASIFSLRKTPGHGVAHKFHGLPNDLYRLRCRNLGEILWRCRLASSSIANFYWSWQGKTHLLSGILIIFLLLLIKETHFPRW